MPSEMNQALGHRGPVVDAHVRVAGAGPQQRLVPLPHVVLGVGPAVQQRHHVDPHHRLIADHRHHPLDALGHADIGADKHIRGVVGAQRQYPAAVVAVPDQLLGDGGGIGLALRSRRSTGPRRSPGHLADAHVAVLRGQPERPVGQVVGRVQPVGGGVADVHHRPAGGARRGGRRRRRLCPRAAGRRPGWTEGRDGGWAAARSAAVSRDQRPRCAGDARPGRDGRPARRRRGASAGRAAPAAAASPATARAARPGRSSRRQPRPRAPCRIGSSTKCHDSAATTMLAATWSAPRARLSVAVGRGGQHDDRVVPQVDAVGADADPAHRPHAEHPAHPAGRRGHRRHDHRGGHRQQHQPAAVQERRVLGGAPDQHADDEQARRRPRRPGASCWPCSCRRAACGWARRTPAPRR